MSKELKITGVSLPEYAVDEKSAINEALFRANGEFPKICDGLLVLPSTGDDRFFVSLYGSGNRAVIALDGTVTQPLEDMEVNLFYRVTDSVSGETADSDKAVKVKVTGKYDTSTHCRPRVMPAIREWCGFSGDFKFSGRIAYSDPTVEQTADQVSFYASCMIGKAAFAEYTAANTGDIALRLDKTADVGDEGYTVEISDICYVSAPTLKGLLYAGATLAQMLMQSNDGRTMPKGMIRDYPQYPTRGIMLDTARYYMDIDYLEEVVKYAGFFKINQVHLHLNDCGGESADSFRLESEVYPELNRPLLEKCTDGDKKVYTKKRFVALQKAAEKYGVQIVPEIDTPSHCATVCMASRSPEAVDKGFGDVSLNSWQIDLRDDKFDNAVRFVQSVFNEYIGGDEPTFIGERVHIGTDEWIQDSEVEKYNLTPSERNEKIRRYMDTMIKYINSKGYTPVIWNGMNSGEKQYAGKTPISKNAVFQTWSLCYSDVNVALKEKYFIINSNDTDLYIVPGVTYYQNDLDISKMYDSWTVGTFGQVITVDEGHPLLLGAETALWLDASCGSSHIDIFKLLKNQIMLISEKSWYGDKTHGQTSEDFISRITQLANQAAGANPGRYTAANDDGVILSLEFDKVHSARITDGSGNGNHAEITGSLVCDEASLKTDGTTSLHLPIKTVSNPFTASIRLYLSKETAPNAKLFDGEDATVYLNYDGSGKLAFERKGYTYIFDQTIPTDKTVSLDISCDEKVTSLYIDGKKAVEASLYKHDYEFTPEKSRLVSTLQLPLETVFAGVKGRVYSLSVSNITSSSL